MLFHVGAALWRLNEVELLQDVAHALSSGRRSLRAATSATAARSARPCVVLGPTFGLNAPADKAFIWFFN
jgi:hypothetical protein